MKTNGKKDQALLLDPTVNIDELEEKAHQDLLKLEEYRKTHNKRTLSRRDFMATGVIPFAANLAVPSFVTSLLSSESARADVVCQSGASGDWAPLITINLTGGSGLSSHWLPLDAGGQMLASYSKMGWGKAGAFGVDYEFSNRAPFFMGSTLLAGMRTSATPQALAMSSFVGVAVSSQDDSANNHFDITGLAAGMGLKGKLMANMATSANGVMNTPTGNGTLPAFLTPPAPLLVGSYDDITGALGVSGGSLDPLVKNGRAGALFSMIQKLSTYQANKYVQYNGGTVLQSNVTCRTQDNTALVAGGAGAGTDPKSNTAFSQIWGIANNTATNSRNYKFGSVVFNALNGNGGSANLSIGGYDYHDNTRTSGNTKDQDAGMVIGQVIQSCILLNKKAFIMVVSDGSVTSADSDSAGSPWTSDGGTRGAAYMIAVNPAGAVPATSTQLGNFVAAQGADSSSVVGGSPERAGIAMFINYLSLNGKLNQIDKVLPRTLNDVEIKKMTVLG